jgi:hypothetical protein
MVIGKKMKSLELWIPKLTSIEFLNPEEISQLIISCQYFTEKELSLFPNLHCLELIELTELTDISPSLTSTLCVSAFR